MNMGSTEINFHVESIDNSDGSLPRRIRERRAIARIVARHFGAGAEISHSADGAPRLAGRAISISHSAKVAVLAEAPEGWRIGVDIESLDRREQLCRVAERVLSPAEMEVYYPDRLVEAWTIKEALVKASGRLDADFRTQLRLPLGDAAGARRAAVDETFFDIHFSAPLPGHPDQWLTLVADGGGDTA